MPSTGNKGPTDEVFRGVHGHCWRTFWNAFRRDQVCFVKVRAHLDYAAVQRGDIAEHEWRGNRLAD
eukprot:5423753-Amphidinium_carterae.1